MLERHSHWKTYSTRLLIKQTKKKEIVTVIVAASLALPKKAATERMPFFTCSRAREWALCGAQW